MGHQKAGLLPTEDEATCLAMPDSAACAPDAEAAPLCRSLTFQASPTPEPRRPAGNTGQRVPRAVKSARSRLSILEAALRVIERGGPKELTLDSVAKEAGLSKGGLTHQFSSKKAVLEALLRHLVDYLDGFRSEATKAAQDQPEPVLQGELAAHYEMLTLRPGLAMTLLGALMENPELLQLVRTHATERLAAIRAEAADPDAATLRWIASKGLIFSAILGVSPLSLEDVERLSMRLRAGPCRAAEDRAPALSAAAEPSSSGASASDPAASDPAASDRAASELATSEKVESRAG